MEKNKPLVTVLPCPGELLSSLPLLGQQSYYSTRKEQGSPSPKVRKSSNCGSGEV